jgi:hypothetical protein
MPLQSMRLKGAGLLVVIVVRPEQRNGKRLPLSKASIIHLKGCFIFWNAAFAHKSVLLPCAAPTDHIPRLCV